MVGYTTEFKKCIKSLFDARYEAYIKEQNFTQVPKLFYSLHYCFRQMIISYFCIRSNYFTRQGLSL